MNYAASQYLNPETGRRVWAVLCRATRTWSFARTPGRAAAETFAAALNAVT